MAKLFLIHSNEIGNLIVSAGPDGDNTDQPTYDPDIEVNIGRVIDARPPGTIIGIELVGETPKVVMFEEGDPEATRRIASNLRRSLGEHIATRNLKAADLRLFAERDDTIFLVTVGDTEEEATGAYYRLENPDDPATCRVLDADGNPAAYGTYERKDDKPILREYGSLRIGENGVIWDWMWQPEKFEENDKNCVI